MSSCGFYFMASILPVTVNQPIMIEWSLHPEVVPGLFGVWDTPTVDMLATVNNIPLSQFRFPISEPPVLAIGFCRKTGEEGVCFTLPPILTSLPRPTVTIGICLEHQVIPTARMYALMQHYQAAAF